MKVLVTGVAGFIGYHVARRLAETRRCEVLGVDNLSDYYDVELKRARLAELAALASADGETPKFRFLQADFADAEKCAGLVAHFKPDYVVQLGAQPGVRFSMENPAAYTRNNLEGFASVLEACRRTPPKHVVFASSSSVYGAGAKPPFREDDNTDQPISYYGATKKANELMAHSYAHNHGLNLTGLRFFTVYGPWGRPDMVLFKFAKAILEGRTIDVFNNGQMKRDFTFVDDVVECVVRLMDNVPKPDPHWSGDNPDPSSSLAPFRVYNIGNHDPVELSEVIRLLEEALGKKAKKRLLPIQPGDVPATYADVYGLERDIGFTPSTTMEDGIRRFVDWYKQFYAIKD